MRGLTGMQNNTKGLLDVKRAVEETLEMAYQNKFEMTGAEDPNEKLKKAFDALKIS